jgi:hypothetical protein
LKRVGKLLVALFVLGACLVFAGALAGGLMDDGAFTQAAVDAAH